MTTDTLTPNGTRPAAHDERLHGRRTAEPFVEHVNLTVPDPRATAELLARIFGWRIRWQGGAIHGGTSVHVGGEGSYVALYSGDPAVPLRNDGERGNYSRLGGLNHIGVVVADLDATEARVREEGLETHSHADYEPGRRFYFFDADGVEYEVVSYD